MTHLPRKLGIFPMRGEGCATGLGFADDVDGANSGRLPSEGRRAADRWKRAQLWAGG